MTGNRTTGVLSRACPPALALVCASSTPAAASEGGLVLVPEPVMLVVLIVLFSLLIIPLNRLLFAPIFEALDERQKKMSGTRERAQKIEADADEVLSRYEHGVREARADAERKRRTQLERAREQSALATATARSEAEHEVARARAEVASGLEEARDTLRAQSVLLAREATQRVLGRPLL